MISSVGSPRRRYTASEIEAANDTDLPDLLEHLGYRIRRAGGCFTTREMDSLRIWNRRTWYRYSEAVGGDAVAFLRHFCGMSFSEAVGYLLDYNGYSKVSAIPSPRPRSRPPPRRERPPFVLPPPNGGNENVCAYLRGRGIAPGVIDSFIGAGLLYEDSRYHDCIFVGRDAAGTPVFAAKRGTRDSFKGDVAGSDKKIAFRFLHDPVLNDVHIFESPIDLMSWLELHGPVNAVALCGLHEAPIEAYLHDYPHIRRIVLCLDADGPGHEAARRLAAKYGERGFEVEDRAPPSGKDWNEYLRTMPP